MKTETIEISDFKQLIELMADKLSCGHWLFRGQSDSSWELTPNIARELSDIERSMLEAGVDREPIESGLYVKELQMLQQTYGTSINQEMSEHSHLNQLLRAQHHGAKTRLLDWTTSLLVATYFASRQQSNLKDFALYAVHCCPFGTANSDLTPQFFTNYDFYDGYLLDEDDAEIYEKTKPERCEIKLSDFLKKVGTLFVRGSNISPRVLAQQGFVSIQSSLTTPLNELQSNAGTHFIKIIISGKARSTFQERIYQLGVRHEMLFPDDDGKFRGYYEDREIHQSLINQCNL